MSNYKVRNPRTGKMDYQFAVPSNQAIKDVCASLRSGQKEWRAGGVGYRIEVMQRWKAEIEKQMTALTEQLTLDTGRKKESILEAQLTGGSIDRWCGIAENFFGRDGNKSSSVPFIDIQQQNVPYTLVGVISPWNFPLLLSLIDTIPALLAGCSVVVKPSEVTPRFIEPIAKSIAAVPELAAVLNYIPGAGDVGAAMLDEVDLVCFTGSVATGRKVYEAASRNFIPAFLELGGKDPALVFDGADLELASSSLLWAATSNSGHSCLSIERIYIQDSIYDEFMELLIAKAKKLTLNRDDLDLGNLGPIIAERQVEIIDDHLVDALGRGAVLEYGSAKCEKVGDAYWCLPTVLSNVDHSMKVMVEETFGPIIPVAKFKDEDEAVLLANDTPFGLSAAVFAETAEKAARVGSKLDAGAISINDAGLTAIIHEGEKNAFKFSGIGATRMGPAAIQRFLRQQVLLVKNQAVPSPWWHAISD